MDLVSVIVPVYGVERYLDRCIRSVVNQSYRHLEIILVDDGSMDRCPAICDTWAGRDPRIRVIHKSNGGLSPLVTLGWTWLVASSSHSWMVMIMWIRSMFPP